MPVYTDDNHVPASGTPMIISESDTHIVVAFEIARVELARHRRFLDQLVQAATPAIRDGE
jgi:hypothetical protein